VLYERGAGAVATPRGCGERIGPARVAGALLMVGRTAPRPTTEAAATGRTFCPVAACTRATGGPKLPERAAVACTPVSGGACATMPAVAWTDTAFAEIGRVKCSSRTATQAGWL